MLGKNVVSESSVSARGLMSESPRGEYEDGPWPGGGA